MGGLPSEKADSIGREAERVLSRAISLDLNVARAWEALGTTTCSSEGSRKPDRLWPRHKRRMPFCRVSQRSFAADPRADLNLDRYADARQTCARRPDGMRLSRHS